MSGKMILPRGDHVTITFRLGRARREDPKARPTAWAWDVRDMSAAKIDMTNV